MACTKILNFSTIFLCENLAAEDFVTLPMGKNVVDGEMLCLGTVSTNLFGLFYAGEIPNLNCRRMEMAGKAVALQQYHEQWSTDTNVRGGFSVVHALSADEHKHSPARIRYSSKVLYTMFRTTNRLRTDVLSFVGCQNSTKFKLASLGMRGAQERALLVSDDNIGTYGSCTRI